MANKPEADSQMKLLLLSTTNGQGFHEGPSSSADLKKRRSRRAGISDKRKVPVKIKDDGRTMEGTDIHMKNSHMFIDQISPQTRENGI